MRSVSGLQTNDATIKDRVDGAKSSGQANRIRRRRVHSPDRYSTQKNLEAIVACELFWTLCDGLEKARAATGRPCATTAAAVTLVDLTAALTGSIRSAVSYLHDHSTWQRLVFVAEQAWPENSARRLPERPASRSQHSRFRARHITGTDTQIDDFRDQSRVLSVEAAITIDLFSSAAGSFSSPSREQTIAGDATYVKALYNTGTAKLVDQETGEVWSRRVDKEATFVAGKDRTPGYYLVDAIGQGNAPGERIILDAALRPKNTGDGAVFCDLVDAVQAELSNFSSEAFAATYDMALHAADQDRLLNSGLIPVAKVRRNKNGELAQLNLGPHRFKLASGTDEKLVVIVVDGTPHIEVASTTGLIPVALERLQTKRRRRKDGTYNVSSRWQIPDRAEVPQRLAKAETRIANQSTREELSRSSPRPRTRTLRTIPSGDPAYRELFGTRESTESMHQHWKASLMNKRARTVGAARLRHAFHCYQMAVNITTLLRHAERTSNFDMFGAWRPPEHRLRPAA